MDAHPTFPSGACTVHVQAYLLTPRRDLLFVARFIYFYNYTS